jgi:GH15 family glucan-1,4-alpha-glucosidase
LVLFGDEFLVKEIDNKTKIFAEKIFENFWDEEEERFVTTIKKKKNGKMEKDKIIDSSILLVTFFENFYSLDSRINQTIEKIIDRLWVKTEVGGCCRFENDKYHQLTRDIEKVPGNPWILSTLLVGNYYILENKLDKALEILKWVEDKASGAGLLPEQVHPYTGEAISVSPYILSHSMYIIVMNNYLEKKGIRLIK